MRKKNQFLRAGNPHFVRWVASGFVTEIKRESGSKWNPHMWFWTKHELYVESSTRTGLGAEGLCSIICVLLNFPPPSGWEWRAPHLSQSTHSSWTQTSQLSRDGVQSRALCSHSWGLLWRQSEGMASPWTILSLSDDPEIPCVLYPHKDSGDKLLFVHKFHLHTAT